jgi:SpoVK/Ycf46/Vps4 family AAA+-type ATPase
MKQNFINVDNKLTPEPNGLLVKLENKKIYDCKSNPWTGAVYLIEDGKLNLPNKVYKEEDDDKFINRVLHYYRNATTQTTGVLLNGIKGTGKTVMAKELAMASDLPIVIVNEDVEISNLKNFYKKITDETVLIFDEIDKSNNKWKSDDLLSFLDGMQGTGKKLIIMTSNNSNGMSNYLFDRCSRIRYIRQYGLDSNIKFIDNVLNDSNIVTDHKIVKDFMIKNIKLLSMDNIMAFTTEIRLFEHDNMTEQDLDYLLTDMNISTSEKDE